VKKFKTDISIIVATWNRAHLISETLESISNQTYENWECLIIDDGSKDNTAKIVDTFVSSDSRFIYKQRSKKYSKGIPGCRNQGIDDAKGDFIIFFDDDDIVHPENLLTCFILLSDKNLSFCRYDKKPFNDNIKKIVFQKIKLPYSKVFKIEDLGKMITGDIPFASCCVMWDKKCFQNERFNEELMYAEEWECYSRILAEGFTGLSLNEVLYYNRKHINSNTGEFQNNNKVRKNSKIKATILIVKNLASKGLLSSGLKKFFIRLGFTLKSKKIIQNTLKATGAPRTEFFKYLLGYNFYFLLRPIFVIKGKLKRL